MNFTYSTLVGRPTSRLKLPDEADDDAADFQIPGPLFQEERFEGRVGRAELHAAPLPVEPLHRRLAVDHGHSLTIKGRAPATLSKGCWYDQGASLGCQSLLSAPSRIHFGRWATVERIWGTSRLSAPGTRGVQRFHRPELGTLAALGC